MSNDQIESSADPLACSGIYINGEPTTPCKGVRIQVNPFHTDPDYPFGGNTPIVPEDAMEVNPMCEETEGEYSQVSDIWHQVSCVLLDPECEPYSEDPEANAGWDLRSAEKTYVPPMMSQTVRLGIKTGFPASIMGKLYARSGIASKHGVYVAGGVMDSGYRGEWKVILHNTSRHPFMIDKGDRICQVVFHPISKPEWNFVEELEESDRGESGFGSSGVN